MLLVRKPRPRSSSARPAIPFVNQERLVLKFPISEFAQWEEEDGKTFVFDKRGREITCFFCRDLHLTLPCSCLYSKDLSIGR